MFVHDSTLLDVFVRTLIVYVALLVGLRIAGKREIGQMTFFDLVVILLIANGVQNAMVGPDTSVTGGLVAAATLLAVNYAVSIVRDRVPWLRAAVSGHPTLLVHDGHFVEDHMRREHVEPDEVLMAMREHGIKDLAEVEMAVLETDGSVSIVPKDSQTIRTRRRVRQVRHGL